MKRTYICESGAVWCANHGLETYYWSCRSEEEDNENAVCQISIHEVDGGCYRLWDSFQVEDHSRNSVSHLKGLRILALESLEALKMYYVIGGSVPSLHREW